MPTLTGAQVGKLQKLLVGGFKLDELTQLVRIRMDCRGRPADLRPLFSQSPRTLALRKTRGALAAILRRDPELVENVVATVQPRRPSEPSTSVVVLRAFVAVLRRITVPGRSPCTRCRWIRPFLLAPDVAA